MGFIKKYAPTLFVGAVVAELTMALGWTPGDWQFWAHVVGLNTAWVALDSWSRS